MPGSQKEWVVVVERTGTLEEAKETQKRVARILADWIRRGGTQRSEREGKG